MRKSMVVDMTAELEQNTGLRLQTMIQSLVTVPQRRTSLDGRRKLKADKLATGIERERDYLS